MTTDYGLIKAMNWSALKHMHESPKAYQWWVEHERADTPSLLLGRAIHCELLERDKFWQRFYCLPQRPPEADGRKKKDSPERIAYDEWKYACEKAVVPGAVELSFSDRTTVINIGESVREHREVSRRIANARHEVVIEWIDEATGTACKCRTDLLSDRIGDVKSTHKLLKDWIVSQECSNRLYHGQLAHYHDGAIVAGHIARDAPPPYVIVVQTVPPYDCGVWDLDAYALDAGRALQRKLMRRYADCKATDWWPGAAPDARTLTLSRYAPGMAEALGEIDGGQEAQWPEWATATESEEE